MRRIGILDDEAAALRLGAFLQSVGIDNKVDPRESGEVWFWIIEEDRVDEGKRFFDQYQADPRHERYKRAAKESTRPASGNSKSAPAPRPAPSQSLQQINMRRRQQDGRGQPGIGSFTMLLIGLSVVTAFASMLGDNSEAVSILFITDISKDGDYIRWLPGLLEIRNGQVWRLITPMFVHFGLMHIVFNMWWLSDLGTRIERNSGAIIFFLLVMLAAALSNLGQYATSGHPNFGGMSGVVYALFGFVWMRSKYDPASGYFLAPNTVMIMIGWFFLCFALPQIANTAHALGLATGVVWGYLAAKRNMARHRS